MGQSHNLYTSHAKNYIKSCDLIGAATVVAASQVLRMCETDQTVWQT